MASRLRDFGHRSGLLDGSLMPTVMGWGCLQSGVQTPQFVDPLQMRLGGSFIEASLGLPSSSRTLEQGITYEVAMPTLQGSWQRQADKHELQSPAPAPKPTKEFASPTLEGLFVSEPSLAAQFPT